jgi:hypothetical protein
LGGLTSNVASSESGRVPSFDPMTGVESADNADEKEMHTCEGPEDDVPDEYFDKD